MTSICKQTKPTSNEAKEGHEMGTGLQEPLTALSPGFQVDSPLVSMNCLFLPQAIGAVLLNGFHPSTYSWLPPGRDSTLLERWAWKKKEKEADCVRFQLRFSKLI
jgi:hypothetical protein